MYSLANIANAYVSDVTTYGILRFIAGVGLAGELGAGITLVSEILHKEQRAAISLMVPSSLFTCIMPFNSCSSFAGAIDFILLND